MKKQSQWRNISISDYYEIKEILKSDQSDQEKSLAIIAIINQMSLSDLYDLDLTKFNTLNRDLSFLQDFPLNTNSKPPKMIKIDGKNYTIDVDFTNFTVAQYIDFQNYWQQEDRDLNIANLLTCFIVPEGKKYGEDYDVKNLSNLIVNKIDILTANEIVFFSLKKSAQLMQAIRLYLKYLGKTTKNQNLSNQIKQLDETLNQFIDGLII